MLDQPSHTLVYQNPYKWIKISWGPFSWIIFSNSSNKTLTKIILGWGIEPHYPLKDIGHGPNHYMISVSVLSSSL